jgi:hypothetical protein
MLSNEQKALIKRAQREALIDDEEYRNILDHDLGFGVRSSTDPRLGDRHFDKILGYFEAIYWRKIDSKEEVLRVEKSVFKVRGYWASKNTVQSNSRERFSRSRTKPRNQPPRNRPQILRRSRILHVRHIQKDWPRLEIPLRPYAHPGRQIQSPEPCP